MIELQTRATHWLCFFLLRMPVLIDWCKLDFYLATSLVLYSVMPVLVTLGASLAYYHYNCTSCFAPIICQWFFSSKLLFWNCRLAFGCCLWLVTCLVVLGRISELNMYVCQNHNLKSVFHSKLDDNWGFLELLQNKHYKICSWGSDMVFFQYYDIRFTEIVLLNVAWWIWKLKCFVSTLLHSFACQDVFG